VERVTPRAHPLTSGGRRSDIASGLPTIRSPHTVSPSIAVDMMPVSRTVFTRDHAPFGDTSIGGHAGRGRSIAAYLAIIINRRVPSSSDKKDRNRSHSERQSAAPKLHSLSLRGNASFRWFARSAEVAIKRGDGSPLLQTAVEQIAFFSESRQNPRVQATIVALPGTRPRLNAHTVLIED
jgi:hypothetical protein